jgi:hypothetical protein
MVLASRRTFRRFPSRISLLIPHCDAVFCTRPQPHPQFRYYCALSDKKITRKWDEPRRGNES